MKRHLLTATAVASFLATLGADNLSAQVPGPGYAASVTGAASSTTSTAFNIIQFGASRNTAYRIYVKSRT
jgi:hypothetical protein